MSTPSPESLVRSAPGITKARFTSLLKTRNSPVVPEAGVVYDAFISGGIDPSFALGQFRVESQWGTAGFGVDTKSWGNSLYDSSLTTHNIGTQTEVVGGTTYTYATYADYHNAVLDYIQILDWYKSRYGLETIMQVCDRWLGPRNAGSAGHIKYVNIIVSDMIEYQYPEGTFYETGDKMIVNLNNFDFSTGRVKAKYPITPGTVLYRGTDGLIFKTYNGTAGNAWFLGDANGANDWGAVFIRTSASPAGQWVYIKNIDPTKIVSV